MSRREESRPARDSDALAAVESFWTGPLPAAFRTLYSQFPQPFTAPCEFFTLEAIAAGVGRMYGMLPQFRPFGKSVGENGLYGFYVTPDASEEFWPVLYWDEDEMFFRPVASDFLAFLRHCVIVGRYETEAQCEAGSTEAFSDPEVIALVHRLELSQSLLTDPCPRSDTELYERLATSDPLDSTSLSHVGCARRAANR